MKQGETYFLTRGWLGGESNIYKEYLFTVEKYGKEMADFIRIAPHQTIMADMFPKGK